jgi:hypothetical protein
MKYLIPSLLFILLNSCNNKKTAPIFTKEYSYNIGFDPSAIHSGSFFDMISHTEYLYFADFNTNKCIKLFKIDNSKQTDSIPLKNIIKLLGDINGISIISRDTIVLNSVSTNKIALINSKGNCYKYIDMDALMNKDADHYELYSTFLKQKVYKHSILFHAEWYYNSDDEKNGTEPTDKLKQMQYWYNHNFESSYFLKVSALDADSVKLQFGLTNFYKSIVDKNSLFSDVPFYTYTHDQLFLYSVFNDHLFIINPTTLNLKDSLKISSKYSTVGNKPSPINEQTINRVQELSDELYSTTALVAGWHYDERSQRYFLILNHKIEKGVEDKIGYKKRPFSILIYNEKFEKIDEIMGDGNAYFGGFNIMTTKGLLIYKNKTNETDKNTTLSLFNYKP